MDLLSFCNLLLGSRIEAFSDLSNGHKFSSIQYRHEHSKRIAPLHHRQSPHRRLCESQAESNGGLCLSFHTPRQVSVTGNQPAAATHLSVICRSAARLAMSRLGLLTRMNGGKAARVAYNGTEIRADEAYVKLYPCAALISYNVLRLKTLSPKSREYPYYRAMLRRRRLFQVLCDDVCFLPPLRSASFVSVWAVSAFVYIVTLSVLHSPLRDLHS